MDCYHLALKDRINRTSCKHHVILQGKHPIPLYFAPTKEEGNEEIFLPDSPLNIITDGKFNHVPLIMGYVSEEGLFVLKGKFT